MVPKEVLNLCILSRQSKCLLFIFLFLVFSTHAVRIQGTAEGGLLVFSFLLCGVCCIAAGYCDGNLKLVLALIGMKVYN